MESPTKRVTRESKDAQTHWDRSNLISVAVQHVGLVGGKRDSIRENKDEHPMGSSCRRDAINEAAGGMPL